MKIDKQNGNVCFNEESHTYWDDNSKFVSVTTMIDSFTNEFDSDFWSRYKALEKILGPEAFKMEKKQLLTTHKVNLQYFIDNYDIKEIDFNLACQSILDEWQKKNRESCERGTAIHSKMENMFYGKDFVEVKKFGIGGKFQCKKSYYELDLERGVYPEYLIYRKSEDGLFRLAGQIDLLIKSGNDIYIGDYKTNESLDEKSFFDSRTKKYTMMKYPLNNLMDCNMTHYTLQLSTYAWMLQMINPSFNIKKLFIVHFDHNGGETIKEIDYLKDDVEKMCKYYKKQQLLAARNEARKPIEF